MSKTIIKNNSISIVELDASMYQDVWQNSLDEDNRRFVPDEVFETLDAAKEVVDYLIKCYQSSGGPFVYAVIKNEDQTNLGYVQLVNITEGWEIGYHIAKRYTGNGYASEAVMLFLQYLKRYKKLDKIYGVALIDNFASRRVLEKNGFEFFFEGEGDYQGTKRKIVKSIKRLR